MKQNTTDLKTSDFDYELPPERIAQVPVVPRDQARLLYVTQNLSDHSISALPSLLNPGDLLVFNDTKVIPARLFGKRGSVAIEVLLHKKQDTQTWQAFARPGKRLHVGDIISFAPDFFVEVLEKCNDGEILVRFSVPDEGLQAYLQQYGEIPLPPYIKRPQGSTLDDRSRYQTVYAAREGAIAAPTAGLHFTPELLSKLAARHIKCLNVTLHVGAGTFLPVKALHLKDHIMHAEWGEVTLDTARQINIARQEGRRIVVIGTTTLRLLETAADAEGVVQAFSGNTDIFIYPGYRFKVGDVLLTNFHLPKSTLFMLVCAFAGQRRMRQAYEYAIAQNYRFYSYGDATLLEKSNDQI